MSNRIYHFLDTTTGRELRRTRSQYIAERDAARLRAMGYSPAVVLAEDLSRERRITEMTNNERAELIQNAIRDYKAAKESGDAQKIQRAINGMENTFIATCLWGVPGTEALRREILAARA